MVSTSLYEWNTSHYTMCTKKGVFSSQPLYTLQCCVPHEIATVNESRKVKVLRPQCCIALGARPCPWSRSTDLLHHRIQSSTKLVRLCHISLTRSCSVCRRTISNSCKHSIILLFKKMASVNLTVYYLLSLLSTAMWLSNWSCVNARSIRNLSGAYNPSDFFSQQTWGTHPYLILWMNI